MSQAEDIRNELLHEWTHFLAAWRDSQATWKDDVATRFAKRFMEPWESEIPALLSELRTLDQELQAARRELR